MKLDEDLKNLPAYAVYKNMIPGVKVYQDTSAPRKNKRPKKRSSDGPRASNGEAIKAEQPRKSDGLPANGTTPARPTPKGADIQTKAISGEKKQKLKRKADVERPDTGKKSVVDKTAKRPKGDEETALTPNVSVVVKKKNKKRNKGKKQGQVSVSSDTTPDPVPQTINGAAKLVKKKKNKKGKNKKSAEVTAVAKVGKETKVISPSKKTINSSQISSKFTMPIADGVDTLKDESEGASLASLMSSRCVDDSVQNGQNLFQWLIAPTPVTKFMSQYWEKAPLLVKRADSDYYKWLLSSAQFDEILRKNMVRYGKNIDITSYTNGQRETHNPVGRAMPAAVWDYYSNGCSVRFLNPQTYVKAMWRLNAMLQEYLGTFVGANVYLTPADSQGFAPHYDDIEAFVLQVEGKKHWKVYKPRSKKEELPRFSSSNFSEDEIGEPVLDVVLEEGDLLYFPRGFIHQAKAVGEHSLHITVSCYQLNSWGDLIKEYLSSAVDQAMSASLDFRKGLPTDYLSYMGISHLDSKDKNIQKHRNAFIKKSKALVEKMLEFTTPDLAADQLGKKFIWDSLPPFVTASERNTCSLNDGEFMDEGQVYNRCELDPDVEVKLIRKNCVRLVFEENSYRLYFTLENSMEYHGEEPQFVEIPEDTKNAVNFLISKYPQFVKIDDLPLEDITAKVQLVADLWEKGIVVTKIPLTPVWDDSMVGSDDDESDDESEDLGSEDSLDDDDDEDNESDNELINPYMDLDYDEFIEDNFGEGADMDDDSDLELDTDEYDDLDEESDNENANGLGKSYIEEITSGDEIHSTRNSKNNDDSEDDVAPQLVSIAAKPKSKKTKSKSSK